MSDIIVIEEGNLCLGDCNTTDSILDKAASAMDKAEAHEITGTCVFVDENGDCKIMTVEALIGDINPEYLDDIISEAEHDNGSFISKEQLTALIKARENITIG